MLTRKRRRYCRLRAEGVEKTEAAILARYAKNTAAIEACRLELMPEIIEEIARIKSTFNLKNPRDILAMADTYADPLKFMEKLMNDDGEDTRLRLDAAKALEVGMSRKLKPKKESVKERQEREAKETASKSRFTPAPPPSTLQ